ncbi:MAG: glycosyltransferase family 4 protein [Myxococcaceae bacterium]
MPTVLIDLRMVRGRLHGIARYALELARRLPALAPSWKFEVLTGPVGLPSNLGALAPQVPQVKCRAGFLSPLEQPALAATLARASCDLFHATSFSLPALWSGKLVATLHDANHLARQSDYGLSQLAYYRLVVGPRSKTATGLITVSDFSRAELAHHLSLAPERFQVIACGVDSAFSPPSQAETQRVRKALKLPPRYVLAVGNAKAHKNLKLVGKIADDLPCSVVLLAGEDVAQKLGFPSRTLELNDVPDALMPALYGSADAVLVPSRHEGFGLPALEGMAAGSAVLAARSGALPEVVGAAGVLLDPDDTVGWRDETLRVLRDEQYRRALVEKGIKRASTFTWDDCARQTLAVYARVLGVSL